MKLQIRNQNNILTPLLKIATTLAFCERKIVKYAKKQKKFKVFLKIIKIQFHMQLSRKGNISTFFPQAECKAVLILG